MAGSDGGLSQRFLLEVISTNSIIFNSDGKPVISSIDNDVDNEISTMNDQVNYKFHITFDGSMLQVWLLMLNEVEVFFMFLL